MDHALKSGLHQSTKVVINQRDLATSLETGEVPYAATPSLIIIMEKVICEMIHPEIPEGYTTVSAEINVKHLLPLAHNDHATCSIHLKFVEDTKLFFDFAIFNTDEDIVAIGAHERFIVNKSEYVS
ncbi:thioesterase family protein [Labilibacter marinus]|uniref:thioesterase family protein n=1 Tax=Labilibacter marinus TaxID=1477105 RepID=UPI0008318316|nr:hypothetical protein [Labilibacter marinus]